MNLSRKEFLVSGISAAAVLLFSPLLSACRRWIGKSDQEKFSRDFGGYVRRIPRKVHFPKTAKELETLVSELHRRGEPFRLQGRAHSSAGQSLTGGHLIRSDAMEKTITREGDNLRVSAGVTWRQVHQSLAGSGREFSVYTDNLDTTVGGTLSAGGIGTASLQHGLQADQILRMSILLPGSGIINCSEVENPAAFLALPCSLGEKGLLLSALLKTAPEVRRTCWVEKKFSTAAAAAEYFEPLLQQKKRPDHFRLNFREGAFIIHTGYRSREAVPGAEKIQLMDDAPVQFTSAGRRYFDTGGGNFQVWQDCFVSPEKFAALSDFTLGHDLFRGFTVPPLIGCVAVRGGSVFSSSPSRAKRTHLSFGLYISAAGEVELMEAKKLQNDLRTLALSTGGSLYRHGYWRSDL